jgi:hypothetical protein
MVNLLYQDRWMARLNFKPCISPIFTATGKITRERETERFGLSRFIHDTAAWNMAAPALGLEHGPCNWAARTPGAGDSSGRKSN